MDKIKQYWHKLSRREHYIVIGTALILLLALFFITVWQPWHKAIASMEKNLPGKRQSLVWMQQTADLLQGPVKAASSQQASTKGANQSLLAIVEQTAKQAAISKSIQQLSPGESEREVRLVLTQVDFNGWVRWISKLAHEYGVEVKEVSAQRQLKDSPNKGDIRVTFVR